jgi:hypothetical protein
VNSLLRGLIVVFFSVGLLGVSGCSTDNETEAQKLAKTAGDPGKAADTKQMETLPPPKTQLEAMQRLPDPGAQMGPNYPGANKKKKN